MCISRITIRPVLLSGQNHAIQDKQTDPGDYVQINMGVTRTDYISNKLAADVVTTLQEGSVCFSPQLREDPSESDTVPTYDFLALCRPYMHIPPPCHPEKQISKARAPR